MKGGCAGARLFGTIPSQSSWDKISLPRQSAASDSSDRIEPSQAGKPEEIRVRRVEDGIVFNGNGGDLSVGHEISRRAESLQRMENLFDLVRRRLENLGDRLRQP